MLGTVFQNYTVFLWYRVSKQYRNFLILEFGVILKDQIIPNTPYVIAAVFLDTNQNI